MSDPAASAALDAGWEKHIDGCPETAICVPPRLNSAEPWMGAVSTPTQWDAQDNFFKYFILSNASFNTRTITFNNRAELNLLTNSTARLGGEGMNSNLAPFTGLGHKLMIYHGWSDPVFSPFVSVNYFNAVEGVLGAGGATTNSVRLFMVPGMHHCQGYGPGPNNFDELTPVVDWVEQGIAPDGIIAHHNMNDDPTQPVDRTMPLCSYPEQAVYDGVGPVNSFSSWSCN